MINTKRIGRLALAGFLIFILVIIGSVTALADEPSDDGKTLEFFIARFPLFFGSGSPMYTTIDGIQGGENNYLYTVNQDKLPPDEGQQYITGNTIIGQPAINIQYHPQVDLITRYPFLQEKIPGTNREIRYFELIDPDTLEVVSTIMAPGEDAPYLDLHDIKWSPDGKYVSIMLYRPTDNQMLVKGQLMHVLDFVIYELHWPSLQVHKRFEGLDWWNPDDSTWPIDSDDGPYDYAHVNSIDYCDKNELGQNACGVFMPPSFRSSIEPRPLVISNRHMNQVLQIDMNSGDVIWRLGGVDSDFTFPDEDGEFSYQHTAEYTNYGILLFNNDNLTGQETCAVEYELDVFNWQAHKVFEVCSGSFSVAQGSAYRYADGNTLISWGMCRRTDPLCPLITEVDKRGDTLVTISNSPLVTGFSVYRADKVIRPN